MNKPGLFHPGPSGRLDQPCLLANVMERQSGIPRLAPACRSWQRLAASLATSRLDVKLVRRLRSAGDISRRQRRT
jgi:hypothetical protein